jgi:hypothetical protein
MSSSAGELSPADAEARRTRLKNLIVLGKERSYLTYAEINDHLPDDMLDAEQIETIISMINDMGVQVYDEAPDAETLLMAEAPAAVPNEEAAEEAEAALSTVDSEFGRTTDPVHLNARDGLGGASRGKARSRSPSASRTACAMMIQATPPARPRSLKSCPSPKESTRTSCGSTRWSTGWSIPPRKTSRSPRSPRKRRRSKRSSRPRKRRTRRGATPRPQTS